MARLRTMMEAGMERASNILDSTGLPISVQVLPPSLRELRERSGIDAAVDNRHTSNHYADADGRPMDAVLQADRNVTRNRLRYETTNNSLLKNVVDQISSDVVGTGPRLQIPFDYELMDEEQSELLEEEFSVWAETCSVGPGSLAPLGDESLADNLILTIREKAIAGEMFDLLKTVGEGPVRLRLQPIQPERVDSPYNALFDNVVDGVATDNLGRVTHYYVMNAHPLDPKLNADPTSFKEVPVGDILHTFRGLEAGQHRGFPELAPGLPIAAQRRAWSLSVLSAAKSLADISLFLTCTGPNAAVQPLDGIDSIPFERNMMINAPVGYDMKQIKSEQPAATHREYDRSLVAETGRAVGMPYAVAAMDASDSNMSSARRDDLLYMAACRVTRRWLVRRKLRRVLLAWLREAQFAIPALSFLRELDLTRLAIKAEWFWDEREPLDELKAEKAVTEGLHNGTRNEIDELKKMGVDYQTHRRKVQQIRLNKIADMKEIKSAADEAGLTFQEALSVLQQKPASVTLNLDGEDDDEPRKDKRDVRQDAKK